MKRLMAITGWTKEDWKEFALDFGLWATVIWGVMVFLCVA